MVNARPASPSRFAGLVGGVLLLATARAAIADDPAKPLARFVPAEKLSAYVEYDGLDAHAAAWKATTAYALLRDTPAGATTADVVRQVVDRAVKENPGSGLTGADVGARYAPLLANGFALAYYDEGGDLESTVIVLRGLGRRDVRPRFDRALRVMLDKEAAALKPTMIRGRAIFQRKGKPKAAAIPINVPGPAFLAAVQPLGPSIVPAEGAAPLAATVPAPKAAAAHGSAPDNLGPRTVVAPVPTVSAVPAAKAADRDGPPMPVPPPEPVVAPVEGVPVPVVESPPTVDSWWFEGDDLIFVSTPAAVDAKPARPAAPPVDRLAAVLDAIEGKRPDASAHPGRIAAMAEGREIAGFEANGLLFIEAPTGELLGALAQPKITALPGLPLPIPLARLAGPEQAQLDELKRLGLDGITRVVGRWGFHGKALLTDIRVEAPAPRKGLASLLDGTSFRKDRLPPIPKGAGSIVVGALDPVAKLDAMVNLVGAFQPDGRKEIDALMAEGEKAVRGATGVRLREDLLGRLRPSWCVYAAPGGVSGTAPEKAAPVLVLGVDDADAFSKSLDTLAARGNAYFRAMEGLAEGAADAPSIALEKLPAPERGYRLTSPSGLAYWLRLCEPTVALGKSSAAFAINPTQARAAIAAESGTGPRWKPDGEVAQALACLPTDLAFLWIGNPHDSSWPDVLSDMPAMVQFLGNFLDSGEAAADPSQIARLMLGVPRPGGFRGQGRPGEAAR